MHETFGFLSGLIVTASVVPYAIRVFQRKIQPNLVSWSVWAVIGLALLLTYRSSGAGHNIWPAVAGFFNPALITLLALWRGMRRRPEFWEIVCGLLGVVAIVWWVFVQNEPGKAQFGLYLAMFADATAAIPTIGFVWREPDQDRPFAWGLFGIGYALALFAIESHTFANYALPVYMFVGASTVTIILAAYRVRNRLPLREWI